MRWLIVLLCAAAATAEIVDRIAATIGPEVIAASQVDEQLRVAAFIDGAALDFSSANKRRVLDRLIDQALVRREVEFTRFRQPGAGELEPLIAQVRSRFPNDAAYRAALAQYGVEEEQVADQLRWQLTMLRFIEYRFQPSVQVSNSEIRQEYRRQAEAWREKNGTEPPEFQAIRQQLEKIVRQRLTDSALDRWLGEMRTQNAILFRGEYK